MPIELESPDLSPVEVSLLGDWGLMADQALFGYTVLGAGLVGLGLQCLLLATMARRRHAVQRIATAGDPTSDLLPRGFSPWPELLSMLLLLAPLIIEGLSLYLRIRIVASALQPPDPSQQATLLEPGTKERFYGPVLASMMIAIQALPAGLAIALGTFYRLRLRGLLAGLGLDRAGAMQPPSAAVAEAYRQHPGPGRRFSILVGLGSGAVTAAFFVVIASFAAHLIETFPAVAGAPPDLKLEILMLGFAEGEKHLWGRLVALAALTTILAAAAFIHLHFFSAATRRHRIAPELPRWPRISRGRYAVALALCLAGSALALRLAWPIYRERQLPPPKKTPVVELLGETAYPVQLPDLTGPDPLKWSPLLDVQVVPDDLLDEPIVTFDGEIVHRAAHLAEAASRRRAQWTDMRPDEPFDGLMALRCDARVPVSTLLPHLRVLQRVGYTTVQLAFVRSEMVERPLLGRFPNRLASAAALRLVAGLPPDAAVVDADGLDKTTLPRDKKIGLRLAPDTRYEALARAVVAARQAGNRVLLAVGADDNAGAPAPEGEAR